MRSCPAPCQGLHQPTNNPLRASPSNLLSAGLTRIDDLFRTNGPKSIGRNGLEARPWERLTITAPVLFGGMHHQAVQVAPYPANRRDSVAHESAKFCVRAIVTSAAETISTAAGAIDATATVQMLSAVSRATCTSARPAGRSTA